MSDFDGFPIIAIGRKSGERRMIRLVNFYRGRCAKSTAHKWINQGRLKAYHVDGMTFVDETFDEFVLRQAAEQDAGRE